MDWYIQYTYGGVQVGDRLIGYTRSKDAKQERFVKKLLEAMLKEVSAVLRQQQEL